ncbi:tetratricopeptide repeat protein [Chitinophagaceae bacterium MMS25-I14]
MLAILIIYSGASAQIPITTPQPVSPKAAKRYEIDAKRMGVAVTSEDALPRSREFLRVDSTYYVGWLYEGAYKMNHAADYIGYKNASVPLARALGLIERDFHKELSTHSGELVTFYPVFRYQVDYTMTAYFLLQCYMNMDDAEQSNKLLRRVLKWNLQRDLYLDVYNYLAWNVHRNRFYTSSKYSFLKNSIDENEALANRYLDSGLRRISRNMALNAHIFPPGYEKPDKLAVYHYKCILYSYNFNIDSASYYFNQMRNSSVFPHNNYATFRMICGDFRDAEKEYTEASAQEGGDKRLKEYIYYSAILDLYKGEPKAGIELLKEMIKANGSTPGFGWYNIGLARAMYYDGQIEESKKYIDKAATFKELHIGTTLGQSHYDFSVQLNKLMNKEAEFEMQRFEHANWWYNPSVMGRMAQLTAEKYLQQFLIINQFAQNPERDRVIYKLFSTESTVTWDEIWYLIRDFSTGFFLDKFQKTENTDNRKYIRKYFQLFIARLYMKQGDYKKARQLLDELLRQPDTDLDYEKLYMARAFEAEATCAKELDNDAAAQDYLYRMYQVYPQLVPFCGQKMRMSLRVTGNTDKDDNAIISKLKDCNISWTESAGASIPEAIVLFERKGKTKVISYSVTGSDGKPIVPRRSFSWQKADEAGTQLAYRLFGIGGEEPAKEEPQQ